MSRPTGASTNGARDGRRGAAWSVALAVALLAAAGALALVAARGPSEPRMMEERVRAVGETLKCPVCQDLSVADSPSGVARAMRQTIGRDLRAGLTPDQIRDRFVDAYGEGILLEPPRNGLGLVAWIAPAVLLALGVLVAAVAIRRWTAASGTGSGTAREIPNGAAGAAISAADRRLLQRELSKLGDDAQ